MSLAHPASDERRWDAFLSYSSRDRAAVARIQGFLERYRLPGAQRLRVYRDETDIAGGELPAQLRAALGRSGCLVVCCSAAAAEAQWVGREIEAFRAMAPGRPVLAALVADEPPANIPPPLRGEELRWSDLRPGWRFGLPRRRTRVELVRLVAGVAGREFRELLPLDTQRRRRRALAAAAFTAAGVGALASLPVEGWDDVTPARMPVFGCDTLDDGVVLYHLNEPQAIKNVVGVHRNFLGTAPGRSTPLAEVLPRGRLLPGGVSAALDARCGRTARSNWVGEPTPSLCVVLSQSEEERSFADGMGGGSAPLTDVSVRGRVALMERFWSPIERDAWREYGRTRHPSEGLPVAGRGREIWIGFPADRFSRGSLWHSVDGGIRWQPAQGIADVRSVRELSIGLMLAGRREGELGFFLYREGRFERFEAPGKGDQLEVCGESAGEPVLRADRRIYLRATRPWWRSRIG